MWVCKCDCGGEKIAWAQNLKGGKTTSCNCVRIKQVTERNRETKRTHGKTHSAEYRIWSGIIDRCMNPNGKDFKNYLGRGITVCDRWRSFEHFFADMGPRPSSKHSIDRIDNEKGYYPENCRWALPKDQANNCRANVHVTHGGITRTISEWADAIGIKRPTLYWRYRQGWRGAKLFQLMAPSDS